MRTTSRRRQSPDHCLTADSPTPTAYRHSVNEVGTDDFEQGSVAEYYRLLTVEVRVNEQVFTALRERLEPILRKSTLIANPVGDVTDESVCQLAARLRDEVLTLRTVNASAQQLLDNIAL
jgi:hypothetical protein